MYVLRRTVAEPAPEKQEPRFASHEEVETSVAEETLPMPHARRRRGRTRILYCVAGGGGGGGRGEMKKICLDGDCVRSQSALIDDIEARGAEGLSRLAAPLLQHFLLLSSYVHDPATFFNNSLHTVVAAPPSISRIYFSRDLQKKIKIFHSALALDA